MRHKPRAIEGLVLRMYRKGRPNATRVAKATGLAIGTVLRIIREANLPVRNRGRFPKGKE